VISAANRVQTFDYVPVVTPVMVFVLTGPRDSRPPSAPQDRFSNSLKWIICVELRRRLRQSTYGSLAPSETGSRPSNHFRFEFADVLGDPPARRRYASLSFKLACSSCICGSFHCLQ